MVETAWLKLYRKQNQTAENNMALHEKVEKVALTSFHSHFLGGVNFRVHETCLDRAACHGCHGELMNTDENTAGRPGVCYPCSTQQAGVKQTDAVRRC